jgi:excinuclease UvrABC nuclease subunit
MINSGIYIIRNKINNHIYIGQTTNFKNREKQHFILLKNNKHHSNHLQNAFNKYGENNFEFKIIDRVKSINYLQKIEYLYIKKYNPIYNGTINKKYNNIIDFDNNICPICKNRLKIVSKSIVSFLQDNNSEKVCINKFCHFNIKKYFEYDVKKLNYHCKYIKIPI